MGYELREQEIIQTYRDFSGGVNNKLHPLLIPDNTCEKLDNLEHTLPGVVRSRLGYSTIADDLSDTTRVGSGIYELRSDGDGVHELNLWRSDVAAGTDNFGLYSWDGDAASWTSETTNTFDVTGTAGALDEIVALQFKDYIIYANATSGAADDWDGTSLSGNVNASPGDGNDDFPVGDIMVAWLGRVWTSGNKATLAQYSNAKPGYVWFSPTYKPEDGNWDRTIDAIRAAEGENCRVTAAVPMRNREMILFCDNAIFSVRPPVNAFQQMAFGVPTNKQFPIEKISNDYGCVARKSAKLIGQDVIFMDQNGDVRRLSRTALEENQGVVGLPISDPIQGYIDRINKPYMDLSSAFVDGRTYYLSVPLDTNTALSHTLVYDIPLGTWQGLMDYKWAHWTHSTIEDDEKVERSVYVLDGTTNVQAYKLNDTNKDDASGIAQVFQHKRLDFALPHSKKIGKTLWLDFVASNNAEVQVFAAKDGGGFQELTGSPMNLAGNAATLPQDYPYTLGGGGVVRVPFRLTQLGRWHDIQIKWTQTGLDKDSAGFRTQFLGYTISAIPVSPRRSSYWK